MKKKRSEKMSRRIGRLHSRKKKEDENEDDDVFELAVGENSPMFWGDVDKKLLHNRTHKRKQNNHTVAKKKRRRGG